MIHTNPFRALKDLLPDPTLAIGTVIAIHASEGASTVQYPGFVNQKVLGTSVPVGQKAFVRSNRIESTAPNLTSITIEV